jgi:hypothetical protein
MGGALFLARLFFVWTEAVWTRLEPLENRLEPLGNRQKPVENRLEPLWNRLDVLAVEGWTRLEAGFGWENYF